MAGPIESLRNIKVWRNERRNSVHADRILEEVPPQERAFFKNLHDRITELGGQPILKKPLNERNRTLTLYAPTEGIGLYTDRFEVAEGALQWFDKERELVIATGYGKIKGKDGIVLSGGIHQINKLWKTANREEIDPSNPENFWGFIHEFPGKFMFYQNYFAFRASFEEDGKVFSVVTGGPTEESVGLSRGAYLVPLLSSFGNSVHRMVITGAVRQIHLQGLGFYSSSNREVQPIPQASLEEAMVEELFPPKI